MTDWDISTLPAAIAGLRDRAQELQDYPGRLHVHEVTPRDLLGAPKFSPAMWRHLTGSIHASHPVSEERICPLRHDTADCPRCGGLGTYTATRDVYSRPLARALWVLARRSSKMDPHPVVIIGALLAEGFSIERAAMRYGVVIMSADQRVTEEARILAAIRALRNRYEETVIGPSPGWLERSDSQRSAEDAA